MMALHKSISCTLSQLVSGLLFVALSMVPLTGNVIVEVSAGTPVKRVSVDLAALPEPFDDTKLPAEQQSGATTCFEMMGCIEPVPIGAKLQDPQKMDTAFIFGVQDGTESRVTFGQVENCLVKQPTECKMYPFDLKSLINEVPYDVSRRTIVLISGYLTNAPTDWEAEVAKIWQELEIVNVITINWSSSDKGRYAQAVSNTRIVARQFTVLLYYLAQLNALDISDDSFAERIYITGHSLGAIIAGFIGQDMAGGVGRITGLDPAGPHFDQLDRRFRLDRSDAQLVDVLHTNGGASMSRYGSSLALGHVDLYANNGITQPGCSIDVLGCSHGKANSYYAALLRHEVSMRDQLKNKYSSIYRMSAYVGGDGGSYEGFQNGAGLARNCPKTAFSDIDLYSSDIDKCSVPIDYFTWYDHVIDELRSRHGINFDSASTSNSSGSASSNTDQGGNKYYFYTSESTDDQLDHYLVRIRLFNRLKSEQKSKGSGIRGDKAADYTISDTGIKFEFRMADGDSCKHQVDKYGLLNEGDHKTIVVPYLSCKLSSDNEIIKLDSDDFYIVKDDKGENIGNSKELQRVLAQIFPQSITLEGLSLISNPEDPNEAKEASSGVFGTIMNAIKFKNSKEPVNERLESFIVRPLRRFHRGIVAHYRLSQQQDNAVETPPKVVLINGENYPPVYDGIVKPTSTDKPALDKKLISKLMLDAIYFGPFDMDLVGQKEEELNYDEILPVDNNSYTVYISSNVSPNVWMLLTVFLMLLIVALVFATSLRVKKVDAIDQQALMIMARNMPLSHSDRARQF